MGKIILGLVALYVLVSLGAMVAQARAIEHLEEVLAQPAQSCIPWRFL